MIKSIKHKGLKRFNHTGNTSGIQSKYMNRLRLILTRLDASICPEDMNLPGLNLHALKGKLKIFYAVIVQENWRVIFRFEGENAYDINYVDYH